MTSRLRTTLAVCFLAGCYVLGWLLILGYLAASYVIVRLMFSPTSASYTPSWWSEWLPVSRPRSR
jgi:hypothetical protein